MVTWHIKDLPTLKDGYLAHKGFTNSKKMVTWHKGFSNSKKMVTWLQKGFTNSKKMVTWYIKDLPTPKDGNLAH